MSGRRACCTHAYTVYTPIGDEGCPEGEPAVHTYTVYTPIGDEGCPEGKPAVHTCCVHSYWYDSTRLYIVHPYW